MKNKILILVVSLLPLISCRKTDFDWQHDYFSFLTNTMEVTVNKYTESFTLKGKVTKTFKDRLQAVYVTIEKEKTTAIEGVHYELTDSLMIFPAKISEMELKLKLIPENITQPLILVVYHNVLDPEKDMSKHIDTITVKLIPTL